MSMQQYGQEDQVFLEGKGRQGGLLLAQKHAIYILPRSGQNFSNS